MSTFFTVIGIICVFAAVTQAFHEIFMSIMKYYDSDANTEPIQKKHRRLRHKGKLPARHNRVR